MSVKYPVLSLLLLVLAAGGRPLRAQAPLVTQPLDSGMLVQMHFASGDSARGRLLARLGPDSRDIVFCRYPGNPCTALGSSGRRALPISGVVRLDRAVGAHTTRDALVGGLSMMAGALLGSAIYHAPPEPGIVLGLGALGTVLGSLIGSWDLVWGPAP